MHVLSAMLVLLFAQRPEVPPPAAPPVLIVNGSAQVMATPDQATVRLGIVRQAPNAQVAQEQANVVAKEILNAVAKAGIPANQIQTARLLLSPVYAPRAPESRDAPKIVAYNATNTVSIRVDNLQLVGPAIDAGLKAGANQLEGVRFSLKNDLPAREEALKQAVAEARSKAAVMAGSLGVTLAEVLEATENGVSVMPFAESAMAQRLAVAADTPVSPGEIQVNANVMLRYRISPK